LDFWIFFQLILPLFGFFFSCLTFSFCVRLLFFLFRRSPFEPFLPIIWLQPHPTFSLFVCWVPFRIRSLSPPLFPFGIPPGPRPPPHCSLARPPRHHGLPTPCCGSTLIYFSYFQSQFPFRLPLFYSPFFFLTGFSSALHLLKAPQGL